VLVNNQVSGYNSLLFAPPTIYSHSHATQDPTASTASAFLAAVAPHPLHSGNHRCVPTLLASPTANAARLETLPPPTPPPAHPPPTAPPPLLLSPS